MSLTLKMPDDFKQELKKAIHEVYTDTIERSRRDAGVNVEYLTKSQAMDLYDCANNTLMQWVSQGLPMYKVNGKVYFKRKEINHFIEQHQIN